jgi:hypothetical protein
LKAVDAGVDVIEGVSEEVLSDEVLAAMAKKNIGFVPALAVQGDIVSLIDPAALKAYLAQPIVQTGLSPIVQMSLARETGAIAQLREAMNEKIETPGSRKAEEKKQEEKAAAEKAAFDKAAAPKDAKSRKEQARQLAAEKKAEQKAEKDKPQEDKVSDSKTEVKDERPLVSTLLQQQQDHARENVRRAKAAGVRVVLGTGAGNTLVFPGASAHREMELLTKAGLSPMEAIVAATSNAAASIGRLNESGTIERGKFADLIILDADPLADITNTTKIDTVIRGGRVIRPDRTEVY